MDLFLEARAACSSGLCKQLSSDDSEGRSETLLDDMRKLRTCLGQTVDTAFALFAASRQPEVSCLCVCVYAHVYTYMSMCM